MASSLQYGLRSGAMHIPTAGEDRALHNPREGVDYSLDHDVT
jgi:hypothetical protein